MPTTSLEEILTIAEMILLNPKDKNLPPFPIVTHRFLQNMTLDLNLSELKQNSIQTFCFAITEYLKRIANLRKINNDFDMHARYVKNVLLKIFTAHGDQVTLDQLIESTKNALQNIEDFKKDWKEEFFQYPLTINKHTVPLHLAQKFLNTVNNLLCARQQMVLAETNHRTQTKPTTRLLAFPNLIEDHTIQPAPVTPNAGLNPYAKSFTSTGRFTRLEAQTVASAQSTQNPFTMFSHSVKQPYPTTSLPSDPRLKPGAKEFVPRNQRFLPCVYDGPTVPTYAPRAQVQVQPQPIQQQQISPTPIKMSYSGQ